MISAFGSVWVAPPQRVVRLDPVTGRVIADIQVGGTSEFRDLAAGDGSIWAVDAVTQVVTRIDTATDHVTASIALAGHPGVVDGFGFLDRTFWVASAAPPNGRRELFVAIDPATNRIVQQVVAPRASAAVVIGSRALWYTAGPGQTQSCSTSPQTSLFQCAAGYDLVRFDPSSKHFRVTRHDVQAVLAAADARLWLLTSSFNVIEIDESTGAGIGPPIPFDESVNVVAAVSSGVVWLAGQADSSTPGTVTPYDAVTHGALHLPVSVGFPIGAITVIKSAVWIDTGDLTRLPFAHA
jgi:hypothetical protein